MNSEKSKERIAAEAFSARAETFLNPPVGFIGYKGFEKFIKELPDWKNELKKEDYDAILANMVQFFGTVPTVPNALRGIDEPDGMKFYGGFDKMSTVLKMLGEEYKNEKWLEAAEVFFAGGEVISRIRDIIVDYLTGNEDRTGLLPEEFGRILEIMKAGYPLLIE